MMGRLWLPGSVGLLLLLLLCLSEDVLGKRNKRVKSRGKNGCEGKHNFTITPEELERRIDVKCKGSISDLTLAGHNGNCSGLTPHLFVQMSNCFWEAHCTLEYNTKQTNYMLKISEGIRNCSVKSPENFTYSFSCTKKKYKILDVLDGTTTSENEVQGLIRSHRDYPWHYRPTNNSTLTLRSPKKKLKHLHYTVHSLSLAPSDTLSVSWGSQDQVHYANFTSANNTQSGFNASVISTSGPVTVSLDVYHASYRDQGFVICYRWEKKSIQEKSACKDLIKQAKCKSRLDKGKSGKGKSSKRNKPRKGRKSKRKSKSKSKSR